jgi:hypothetical protein
MVFDDDFTTVSHLKLGTVPTNWPEIFENSRELVTDEAFQLNGEWTNQAARQPSVQWISAAIDSQLTTLNNLLDSSNSLPSHEEEALYDDAHALQNEGAHVKQNERAFQNLDPFTGEESSPYHHFKI